MRPHFIIRCSKLRTALGLAVLSVLLWTHPAWATTRTVDTLVDNASLTTCSAAANDCSLRGALSGASANDTINFDPSLADQTITLALGELAISQPVTIDGSTALTVTVSGNNTSPTQPLTVTSMIIANPLAKIMLVTVSGWVVEITRLELLPITVTVREVEP